MSATARMHGLAPPPLLQSVRAFREPVADSNVAKEVVSWSEYCPLFRAGQELCSKRRPIDFTPSQKHLADSVRIGDVVERVGIKHDEVGFFAGSDGAHTRE